MTRQRTARTHQATQHKHPTYSQPLSCMFYVFHVYFGYGTMRKARTSSRCVQVQKDNSWPIKLRLFTRNIPRIDIIHLVCPSAVQSVKEKALKAFSMGWCGSS